jgi:hypothetical protein
MAIPIHTAGSIATMTTLSGPIIQLVRNEVQRKKDEILGNLANINARPAPTHIGMGLRVSMDDTHVPGEEGMASDFDVRFDMLTMPIDGNNSAPAHPTPAVHVKTDLRAYDRDGEPEWLVGAPLEDTRLRSIEAELHWNETGWDADITLNDAVWQGAIDWTGPTPGRMNLSSHNANTDLGFGSLLDEMLVQRKVNLQTGDGDAFMRLFELLDVAQAPLTNADNWVVKSNNFSTLCTNPTQYLAPILQGPNGNWKLDKILSNVTGQENTIFKILSERFLTAEYIEDSNHPRYGQLALTVPLRATLEGATVYVHPDGKIEFDLNKYPIGPSNVNANLLLDFAGGQPSQSNDGIVTTLNVQVEFTRSNRGPFSGAYLEYIYDELSLTPKILDLHLPRMGNVLSPLHSLNTSNSNSSVWLPTESSIRIYPVPTVGQTNIGDFLSNSSPTLILEMVAQTAIDAYLLSGVKENGLFGEIMEALDLVEQSASGRYRCASLLSFIRSPVAYLRNRFVNSNGTLNTSTLIDLAGAFAGVFLPDYILSQDHEPWVEFGVSNTFSVKVEPTPSSNSPDGVKISLIKSPNPASVVDVAGEICFNINPGPVLSLVDTNLSLVVRPFVSTTNIPSVFDNILTNQSSIELDCNIDVNGLSVQIVLDGLNSATHTLGIYPSLSGFSTLLSSAVNSVIPPILTNAIDGLPNSNLKTLLTTLLEDIGLWQNSEINATEFSSLIDGPGAWITGYMLYNSSNPSTKITRLHAFSLSILDMVVDLATGTSLTKNYYTDDQTPQIGGPGTNTLLHSVSYPLANGISITAGYESGFSHPFVISISLNKNKAVGSVIINGNVSVDVSFDPLDFVNTFTVASNATIYTGSLVAIPINIEPALSASWSTVSGFAVEGTTDYTPSPSPPIGINNTGPYSGPGFWFRFSPTDSPKFNKGMPSLLDLAKETANMALKFVADAIGNDGGWLDTQLISGVQNTKPGEILEAFSIIQPRVNPDPVWNFKLIDNIISAYSGKQPIDIILEGIMSLISPSLKIASVGTVLDISIVAGQNNELGIQITLNEDCEFELGELLLKLEMVDSSQWSTIQKGFTIWLVTISGSTANSTLSISPDLQISIGGLGATLYRSAKEPILDDFLLLNKVGLFLAVDYNHSQSTLDYAGALVLDDFGINLGGGSNDGGNGMAKGLLEGGEEDTDSANPQFDIAITKQKGQDVNVTMVGQTSYTFPLNKKFGPLNVTEIKVAYEKDTNKTNHDRLLILVDADATIAGVEGKVDDLGVNIPILKPLAFDDWNYEMKAFAVQVVQPGLSITGALAKEEGYVVFDDTIPEESKSNLPTALMGDIIIGPHQDINFPSNDHWALQYVEYQGMCSIITPSFGINAIGAFARVPKPDGTGFISCFIIGGLNMPIGGPPFFFVNGLLGGLGINRGLPMPDIDDVQNHAFMTMLGTPPINALESIKRDFPMEYGSYWFALGLKFSTFQVMNTRAVLFAKFGNGLTIGLMGLAEVDIPDAKARIAYVELGILAYFDSNQNVLWVQAQLTDNSFLFDQSCRLTGGFALVTWFNSGEFVLSLGGYAPQFNVPDYYPVVDRLGFIWTPTSALTVKGGTYFTICSRGAMVGGRLDASYEKGKLLATFVAGMDCFVQFDPFKYDIQLYISISGKYGRFGATIGADLHIMGPRMHGTASLEFLFIKATVAFGNPDSPPSTIGLGKFMLKHVEQKEDYDEDNDTLDIVDWLKGVGDYVPHSSSVVSGAVQETEVQTQTQQPDPEPGTSSAPHLVSAEFELRVLSKMPSESITITDSSGPHSLTSGIDNQGNNRTVEPMKPTPIGAQIDSEVIYSIQSAGTPSMNFPTLKIQPTVSGFAPTLWNEAANKDARYYIDGALVKGIAEILGNTNSDEISIDSVEPCEMYMHAPLVEFASPNIYFEEILNMEDLELPSFGVDVDDEEIFGAILGNQFVFENQQTFFEEVEYVGASKEVLDAINVDEVIA